MPDTALGQTIKAIFYHLAIIVDITTVPDSPENIMCSVHTGLQSSYGYWIFQRNCMLQISKVESRTQDPSMFIIFMVTANIKGGIKDSSPFDAPHLHHSLTSLLLTLVIAHLQTVLNISSRILAPCCHIRGHSALAACYQLCLSKHMGMLSFPWYISGKQRPSRTFNFLVASSP